MTEDEILDTLDNSNDGYYRSFVSLGHVYSYLIDTRLNVFRADNNRWAIVIERLGYNPRGSAIILDINYYGNCLTNLDYYNERPTSYYSVWPIDIDDFCDTISNESLKPDANFWVVRGHKLPLTHHKQDYINLGIELKEYEPNEITAEEVGRLIVSQHQELFRATDLELNKSIPKDLKKIMVLDEWFHKDFNFIISPTLTEEQLLSTYEYNKKLTGFEGITFEDFTESHRRHEILSNLGNRNIWGNNRPSSYETWQQIAKVIVTNDTSNYRPTLKANTHWANWPDSGSF
jgi:hypothetical protein